MACVDWARLVAKEFEYSKEDVRKATKRFVRQLDDGLRSRDATMSQIPSYVTAVPDGTETGLYLAVDLGGTNLRVCSVDLHGDTTFTIKQSKVAVPPRLMTANTAAELFSFLAEQLNFFLRQHHEDMLATYRAKRAASPTQNKSSRFDDSLLLGFTFSFTFEQEALDKGTMLRWTKGFNIPDAMGRDICEMFQTEIDRFNLPVRVVALINDTVGTLLARSYTSPGNSRTLLGAIFGTGTNGAYVEKTRDITKLDEVDRRTSEDMILNTEWGSFDNELLVLPNTSYDEAVDRESVHPGIQLFEKRTSGMYLGEVLRHVLLAMASVDESIAATGLSRLNEKSAIDASFLSMAASDNSDELVVLRKNLKDCLHIDARKETAEAVKIIALAIGERAARLAGVAVAGVIIKSGRLIPKTVLDSTKGDTTVEVSERVLESGTNGTQAPLRGTPNPFNDGIVDVGVNGSLIEFYPRFEEIARSALRDVEEIGIEGEKRIRIGIAQDGSGVGAALAARMAEQAHRQKGR
ncbi:hypothetical protein F5884DRAFT_672355 [Xylogone sp. PMI_703]|nr:hypothetical protein F5884DRAFT_672355 [Xylogone sp. PMI_703]